MLKKLQLKNYDFLELKFDVSVRQRELARTEARATARATL